MESKNRLNKGEVKILDMCKEKFSFLVSKYGFKIVKKIDNIEMIYQNETTGVQILFDYRENQIFVMIFQLINGKLIKAPIFISSDTVIHGYDLKDILSLKIPGYTGIEMRSDSEGYLGVVLDHYAKMLQMYASEILLGDFTLFPRLERIVKSRI